MNNIIMYIGYTDRYCNVSNARASIGGGWGDASPHFSAWGDSIGIPPPTFQLRKIARHIV